MGELADILVRPLTGALHQSLETVRVERGGLEGDQRFVLYQANKQTANRAHPRVDQGQSPRLGQLAARLEGGMLILSQSSLPTEDALAVEGGQQTRVFVDEFGDVTSCVDLGNDAAAWFRGFLEVDGIRLAQKQVSWRNGINVAMPPSWRANAPLHVVSVESLSLFGSAPLPYGTDNFRPNLLVEGCGEISQDQVAGRRLRIGKLTARVMEWNERCPTPLSGIYAAPEIKENMTRPFISIGDAVAIV